jgi:hypothetical protein
MEYDLHTRVVSLEHQSTLHSQQIAELEKWQRLSDIADARKDEQFKNMDMRFTSIDKKIEAINATYLASCGLCWAALSWGRSASC